MTNEMFKKEAFKKSVKDNVKFLYRKTIEEATQEQIFQAVSYTVKDVIIDNWLATQKAYEEQDPKIVYYMSMEFLMGRALGNNLINLCAYGEVKEALEELGFDLNCIEDQEPDPALGNGGLGRLAACFLDSLATLNYAAYGCGIRYHYGMFKQKIQNGYQIEVPDNWLKNGYPFELRRPEYSYEIKFGGYVRTEDMGNGNTRFIHEGYQSVMAIPYDMPIVGYDNHMVNTLMIWDAEPTMNVLNYTSPGYKEFPLEHNLAKAKQLAHEVLGDKRCDVTYCINGAEPLQKGEAELIAYWLGKIGLNVHIQSLEYATRAKMLRKGDYDIARLQKGLANGDPYEVLNSFLMPTGSIYISSHTGYQNKELQGLMQEVKHTVDEKERQRIFDRVQEIAVEEEPLVALFNDMNIVAYNKRLKNYKPLIYGVDLSKVELAEKYD